MITAGIDIGSRNTKLVLWDTRTRKIIFKTETETGIDPSLKAKELIERGKTFLDQQSRGEPGSISGTIEPRISRICSTGYGRKLIDFRFISEISCHAKGVLELLPETRTVIDIGGQDSKAIALRADGSVTEFAMNDKCAAGTGSFLEKVADIFGLSLREMWETALRSEKSVEISSTCVVFAESEIISLINRSVSCADILMSVHRSVSQRINNLLSGIDWHPPVSLTGGVALNRAIRKTLSEELGTSIEVPEDPLFTGALGAALYAGELAPEEI